MIDTQGGEAATVETTTQAAPEAAVLSQDRDYEADAAKQGWRPKDEWKGDPDNWKDAKTYVEHGDVKSRVDKVEREYADRFAKLEKQTQRTIAAVEKAAAQEIADLKAQKTEAIRAGDVEAVAKLDAAIDTAKSDKRDEVNADAAFKDRNAWYGDDEDLTGLAIRTSEDLVKAYAVKHKGEQMPLDEMFEAVERKVKASADYKAKFPDKKAPANGHAGVDGGSDFPGTKTSLLSRLPNEARAQAKADMAAYPKIYPNEEAWIRTYDPKILERN